MTHSLVYVFHRDLTLLYPNVSQTIYTHVVSVPTITIYFKGNPRERYSVLQPDVTALRLPFASIVVVQLRITRLLVLPQSFVSPVL